MNLFIRITPPACRRRGRGGHLLTVTPTNWSALMARPRSPLGSCSRLSGPPVRGARAKSYAVSSSMRRTFLRSILSSRAMARWL